MASFNWADDAHDADLGPAPETLTELPPRQESMDASGIRTIVEYHRNEHGEKVKRTRKFRPVRRTVQVNKNVPRRRNLAKFGDAFGATEADQRNVTYLAYDEISLVLQAGKTAEEADDDPLNKLGNQKSIVVCRHCHAVGDHWTLKCPLRNGPLQQAAAAAAGAGDNAAASTTTANGSAAGAAQSSTGAYIAPSLRPGANRTLGRGALDDMPTIRITNLSEDTTEADLSELLAPFGRVNRIRLAKDRVTFASKGYAFISFADRDDAQRAIDNLNNYGYDNLILRVDWSKSMQQLMREREENEATAAAAAAAAAAAKK